MLYMQKFKKKQQRHGWLVNFPSTKHRMRVSKSTPKTDWLTEEVISGDEVSVPDLQRDVRRNLELDVAYWQNTLFLAEDNLLLGSQVLERKHEPPVEVAFARQWPDIAENNKIIINNNNK